MSSRDAAGGRTAAPAVVGSVDSFLETKLHWPRVREGWVDRHRLLEMFDRGTRRPVTLVAAPAGYGKTTLAAQWLSGPCRDRSAAWVAVDAADNDPGRLWSHVATALERAGCALASDVDAFLAADNGELMAGHLARVINALSTSHEDVVLILDDFHFLQSQASRDQVQALIENLPEQAHLVILTRADPGIRLGRLRASGLLAEIRAEHLSFTVEEAAELLDAERVELSAPGVEELHGRTEGWPAGVYLASMSLSGRTDADDLVRSFSGTDRFFASYFWEEVLSQGSAEVRDLIISISILDRFCASLCDAVAETTGSGQLLDDMARKNLFLVPLDGERRWFRFHHLFAAVARSELDLRLAGQVPGLHERAARWYADNGHVGEAIAHLRAAGRRDDAARLVHENWMAFVDAGRAPTVLDWLQSLGRSPVGTDPAEQTTWAWLAAIFGDEAGVVEHLRALEGLGDYGPLPDGSRSVESAVSMIGGLFGYGGPLAMKAAAQRAVELETDGESPFYATAHVGLGHSQYIAGELNLATQTLDKGSLSVSAPAIIQVLGLSVQSLAEGELGRLERSRELAERAMEVIGSRALHSLPQAGIAFAALGQVQATLGKVDDAMATLEQGLALRQRHPIGFWGPTHHTVVMARVAVQAFEISMAQELLSDLHARLARFPDGMQAMRARVDAIESDLRDLVLAGARGTPLTAREREILLLLQGALSVREIGAALYLSPNTVKTHLQALYRKLGAHSREEAVAMARRDQLV